ncbi:hypothetical protein NOR51B_1941 [Luminiphilus syltensis NOR5-1B]|uniref:Uncharacterized protein n=1 Tax=Luminiphilus syltensis NOR5-1B TaxID=565045 RepID=B8KVV1_9GAMM|nr:hypothetical protein NOR51B_1941 [Luminiphilus syltensis NOR5-1B]
MTEKLSYVSCIADVPLRHKTVGLALAAAAERWGVNEALVVAH